MTGGHRTGWVWGSTRGKKGGMDEHVSHAHLSTIDAIHVLNTIICHNLHLQFIHLCQNFPHTNICFNAGDCKFCTSHKIKSFSFQIISCLSLKPLLNTKEHIMGRKWMRYLTTFKRPYKGGSNLYRPTPNWNFSHAIICHSFHLQFVHLFAKISHWQVFAFNVGVCKFCTSHTIISCSFHIISCMNLKALFNTREHIMGTYTDQPPRFYAWPLKHLFGTLSNQING